MDYGITWQAAIEEALAEMESFDVETETFSPGMEAADGLSDNPMGAQSLRSTESVNAQARRSRAQTGERDSTFNTDKTKGSADKTPQQWIEEYEARIKAVQIARNKVADRLAGLVRTTIQGNADFMKNLKQSGSKPQETVTVTNWMYAHDPNRYLHAKIVRMKQVMDTNCQEIIATENKEGVVLVMNRGDLEEAIMRQIGAPSNVERYTQLMSWIQTQFRGRKAEMHLSAQDINKYVRQMEDFTKVETQLKGDLANVDRAIQMINAKVRNQLNSSTVSAQEKGRIMKRVNHMGRVFAMYNNMVYMIYRLHVEYVLNRRAILKRLYAAPVNTRTENEVKTRAQMREEERKKAGDLG